MCNWCNNFPIVCLQCDLEYPVRLHLQHSQYSLAPERMAISDEMLSDYSRYLKEKFGIGGRPTEKLILNLMNKQHYTLHYRCLKEYLALGLKLKRIQRILEFTQEAYLKPYIDLNTRL